VPQVRFNFTNIGDLQNVEKDSVIDTIGILKEIGETSQIVSKTTSKPYDKRELTLVDNTNYSVRLTIWGSSAASFDVPLESVVAFKGLKVSDFGGRSLSLLSSGSMSVDPDIDEAHKLKGWYDAQGRNDSFTSHHRMEGSMSAAGGRQDAQKTTIQIKDDLGPLDNPIYFSVKGSIVFIRPENIAYPACLSQDCNKKVVEVGGEWRCEKCEKTHPKPEYRYILSVSACDHTGQLWLSCFDEAARVVMGMCADQLVELRETDDKAYTDAFQAASCQTWMFKCRANQDTYQDVQRYVNNSRTVSSTYVVQHSIFGTISFSAKLPS
jgi:replication factor A1